MSTLREWSSEVNKWKEQFKHQRKAGIININLAKRHVHLTPRICSKCGRSDREIHRHHRGHEYLFAQILPEKYAARYIKFLKKDIVELCNKCHIKIHKLYGPRLAELWPLLAAQNGRLTFVQCERFRLKLIRCC